MRIFLTLSPSGNSAVPGSMTWYHNLYEPLLDLGHEVFLFRLDLATKRIQMKPDEKLFKEKFSQLLLSTFKSESKIKHFELILSYLGDKHILTSCIDDIKGLGVLTANFSCNNVHQFYYTKNIAPYFDYNLHSEKNVSEKFKAIGANPMWFPMAANPTYYYPMYIDRTLNVSFVGANYAKRSNYVWNMLENNIDINVFGSGWRTKGNGALLRNIKKELIRTINLLKTIYQFDYSERSRVTAQIAFDDFTAKLYEKYKFYLHYPVSDDEMIRLFNKSKINIGFLEVFDNHDHSKKTAQHIHLREFEVPMCRGLYLTNYSDELSEFFIPDKEVVVFRNEYELIDKIKYYLSHPNVAEEIRESGYKRSKKCHTYQKRFEQLFEKIFI